MLSNLIPDVRSSFRVLKTTFKAENGKDNWNENVLSFKVDFTESIWNN